MIDATETLTPIQTYDALVRRVLYVASTEIGDPTKNFIVRYRGRLLSEDSEAAYDQLAEWLRPYNVTPLFRPDEDRHAIILVPGMPRPNPSNPVVNLVLFILTIFSVLLTGALYGLEDPLPAGFIPAVGAVIERGWPFAVSLLAILGSHEFGHYLAGRAHGVHVTLPYFIPMPFTQFGTMGAFINMKEPPKNRKVLLDIGIAGPLAGAVIAIPVLLLGLNMSEVNSFPASVPPGVAYTIEGNSIIYLIIKYLTFGQLLPQPASYGDFSQLEYWLRFFFTGRPLPLGGTDVLLNAVAWAGWAGLLVTGLNLIPVGQLDGGHMLYVLFGRRTAQLIQPFILVTLVGLGFFWQGWWLWAFLIFFLGRSYAEPLDQITPLNPGRRLLAVAALALFLLTFTPVPISLFTGG